MKWPQKMTINTSKDSFPGALVATWNDIAAYYRASDGVVWCFNVTRSWVNCGPLTAETFANRHRGTWAETAQ